MGIKNKCNKCPLRHLRPFAVFGTKIADIFNLPEVIYEDQCTNRGERL